jgi:hypothetical protein
MPEGLQLPASAFVTLAYFLPPIFTAAAHGFGQPQTYESMEDGSSMPGAAPLRH